MGPRWLEFFRAARGASAESIDSAIRFAAGPTADRQEAARRLGEFKRRLFLQIAIADLVGRLDVAATMRAMSRLADECISAALDCARLIVGRKAPAAEGFCVLGMGKLGAQELNLSSDIDLIYVYRRPGRRGGGGGTAGRDADRAIVGEMLSRRHAAASGRQKRATGHSVWGRAQLLPELRRDLGAGRAAARAPGGRRARGRTAAARRAQPLRLSPLSRLRYAAPVARDEASDRARAARARSGRPQHQARLRRNSRAGIHRAGAHPGLWRSRSAPAQRRGRWRRSSVSVRSAISTPTARANWRPPISFCATSNTSCRLSPRSRPTCCPPTTRAAVRWRRGWAAGRMPRPWPVSRPNLRTIVPWSPRSSARCWVLPRIEAAAQLPKPPQRAWRGALDPHQSAPILQALGFARPEESAGHLLLLARGPRTCDRGGRAAPARAARAPRPAAARRDSRARRSRPCADEPRVVHRGDRRTQLLPRAARTAPRNPPRGAEPVRLQRLPLDDFHSPSRHDRYAGALRPGAAAAFAGRTRRGAARAARGEPRPRKPSRRDPRFPPPGVPAYRDRGSRGRPRRRRGAGRA